MPVAEVAESPRSPTRCASACRRRSTCIWRSGRCGADGYHELTTVFQAVSMYDEIVARAADGLHLRCPAEARGVPPRTRNLAWRAAELLAEHADIRADVALEIAQVDPGRRRHGRWLGRRGRGAARLRAAVATPARRRPNSPSWPPDLGSDVAFPLAGGTALGTGRGEQLTPVLATGEFHWVFALADYGISAGAAYAELDRLRATGAAPDPIGAPDELLDALRAGDCGRWPPRWPTTCRRPRSRCIRSCAMSSRPARELGALAGIVSGSGPTCAFLCARRRRGPRPRRRTRRAPGCAARRRWPPRPAHGARVAL